MSDGPRCPECESRHYYSLHSTDMFSDVPNSTWMCSKCRKLFKQLYKPSGIPIEIKEVDE